MAIHFCLLAVCGALSDDVALNGEWARQAFSEAPGQAAPANRLAIVHEDGVGDTKMGLCAAGGSLRLGEKTYERGVGVNSHSVLRVTLGKPAASFQADIGLDRNVDNTVASVRFHVSIAGRDAFATDVVGPGHVQSIDVALDGARTFDLVVDVGGNDRAFDQADWCDARVVLGDGSVLWLDELEVEDVVRGGPPFSFVYDGRPSTEFITDWPRTIVEEAVDATQRRRTLTLKDPNGNLEVRAECIIYLDTPGVDWTVYFTNTGAEDSAIIENVKALDTHVVLKSVHDTAVFHSLRSSSGVDDWIPFDQTVSMTEQVAFAPVRGRSSCGACPFFNVSWPGGGVITGIGWTGQWGASVTHTGSSLHLEAGMQNLRLELHPGETIRTPRILQLYFEGDDLERAQNLWRRTMFRHILPKLDGQPVTPPIAHLSTAFYEMDKGTEADVLAHLDAVKGLGFEFFWLDAYYGKDDFPAVGNYVLPLDRGLNLERFPNGIKPIGDAAHAAGMKFLWWVEPERICPGTLMATEHPEWVVMPEGGGWGMFNLAVPEAREYITYFMNAAIAEYGVECLRVDNAVDFNAMWRILDAKAADRTGMAEIRYVEGLYRMWDDILAANPGLFIDDCSSGGHRIDLELCSRALPLWRTDATIHPLLTHDHIQAALQNQVMTAGLSRYVPFSTSGQMGATPYLFRSGYNAGIAFCEDCRPADYPRDLLKQAIAEGKRIRKYYFGDLYALSDITVSPHDWCVTQYHRPDHDDGMLLAFRRHESPYAAFDASPRAIDPEATYTATFSHDYQPDAPVEMLGEALERLRLEIGTRPGSVIVEYRRADD